MMGNSDSSPKASSEFQSQILPYKNKRKMSAECDEIASIVLTEFRKLPTKRKPCVRDNGLHEWVPLSGIVAKGPGWTRCVALATGMKCLPASKLPQANGTAIHDWHAEVLAIRSFNYFVLEECRRLSLSGDPNPTSDYIRRRPDDERHIYEKKNPESGIEEYWHGQPFAWRDDVSLHMYCSEAPCGDASMELIMAAQDDASPWDVPSPLPDNNAQDGPSKTEPETEALLGRGYFSQLGIVRRKPSRGDAPPSLSKSCSDKLALKQCTSLLSSLSSLLVSPSSAYLTSIILPESQYSTTGCQRCFSATPGETAQTNGRMKPLLPYLQDNNTTAESKFTETTDMSQIWKSSGYAFTPFQVQTTTLEFDFSKRTVEAKAAERKANLAASNLAVAWSANGLNEGIIGGVQQGRKKFDIKGASAVSRRKLWKLAAQIAENQTTEDGASSWDVYTNALVKCLSNKEATYDEVKECPLMKGRRAVKEEARREALKGWIRNTGDGAFRLSDQ